MDKEHVAEYDSALNDKIRSFAGKWMELQNIILSGVSRTEKDKHYMFTHLCNLIFKNE
jgi:hypothetical protein